MNRESPNNIEMPVVIANKEQLLDAYPEWFTEVTTNPIPFHLENKPERHNGKDHRYIITPSGLIRLGGKEDLIWDIDKDDTDILSTLNVYARNEDLKWREGKGINDSAKKFIKRGDYFLTPQYIPYGDAELTNGVFNELETSHKFDSITEENIE